MRLETTLSHPVSITGVGLHTGKPLYVRLLPAPEGHGIVFFRTDVSARIPAIAESAGRLDYATALGEPGREVSTVEHFLAACLSQNVDNILVEVSGPELPILDGSALPWIQILDRAGRQTLTQLVEPISVEETLSINGFVGKHIEIRPSSDFRITYSIDFPHPAIRKQAMTIVISPENFRRHISAARTFGFFAEYEYLKSRGLARGASLENCIVIGKDTVENGPLRFPDEFVRHKILDLVGDLALLGRPLLGHVVAHRAGHQLHAALALRIRQYADGQLLVPSLQQASAGAAAAY